jgi:cellulose synthase/poly-beta-1,6-N-acetylglucosamine synthase-like glycosyltransferase
MLLSLLIGSLLAVIYIYVGYPIIALIIARLSPRPIKQGQSLPTVSILIAAYNESHVIEATIKNKLSLNYPSDKLEIIIVSDGSTDGTDEIVARFDCKQLRLLRQEPRAGKTSALNMAIAEVSGEIIVFSDANSLYAPDALYHLVANFADPEVGYVTGKMVYTNPDGTVNAEGCSAYMKYENFLRGVESQIGSVVGVDGGIDAVRKKLYRPMRPDQLPDFVLPLNVVDQGYRVVYEEKALLHEPALSGSSDEYRMRVRVSLRAYWALWDMRHLLFKYDNLLFAWQLWSHKVLRYLCFIFLIVALTTNIALYSHGVLFKCLLATQIFCYAGGYASPLLEKIGYSSRLLGLCRYFTLLNMASAHAFFRFFRGQKQVLWTPRKG